MSKTVLSVKKATWKKDFKDNGIVYLLFLLPFVFLLIFNYVPMVWLLMGFEKYTIRKGLFGSEWVWFDNFIRLFKIPQFWLAFRNTVCMALINLAFGFFFPLVLALLLSEVRIKWFKRTAQTISFLPYFISTVVVCMMARFFLDSDGAITQFFAIFGLDKQNLLANDKIPVFWLINGFLEVWQKAGYNSIAFVAVLASIDGELLEAASIDGANRWQRMWKIKLPGILPFVVMMLTMNVGMIFMQGFDKILLLYSPDTYPVADCMATFIYRYAFTGSVDYPLSTAAGLFQSIIATVLMIFSNWLNRRIAKSSLF